MPTVIPIPIPGSAIVEALGNAVDDLRFLARQHPSVQRDLAAAVVTALLCAVDDDEVHVHPVDGLEGLYVLDTGPVLATTREVAN